MKITGIHTHILKPSDKAFQWREDWAPRHIEHVLLRLVSDEGHEGHCLTWLLKPSDVRAAIPVLQSRIIGRDPHDVEAISYELTDRLERPSAIASTVDICLWDLLGKHHKEPVYRLLGAARDRIRAYASTFMYDRVEEFVDLALQCREQGFTAFKIHAYGVPDKDIKVCQAVRKAVGDTMDLMLDPVNAYDRQGAFKVGQALQDLDFYWFEAPIADSDLIGLADLTRTFRMPIAGTESVTEGLRAYPRFLTTNAVDSVRAIGDWIGGISAMRKTAGLCEAFNVKFEPHSYGTTLIQAAHLNVMLAMHNCDFVEIPVPQGILDVGMKDVIRIERDGYVNGPTKPGLGYDVDLDLIKTLTVEEFQIKAPAGGGSSDKTRHGLLL